MLLGLGLNLALKEVVLCLLCAHLPVVELIQEGHRFRGHFSYSFVSFFGLLENQVNPADPLLQEVTTLFECS